MRVPSQAVIVPCSYTIYTSRQPLHLLRAIAVSSVAQAQGALHSLLQCLHAEAMPCDETKQVVLASSQTHLPSIAKGQH